MSSADWMPRNFVRRIEVLFPVEDPTLRARLLDEVLGIALADNVKARRLQVDGSYLRVTPGGNGTPEVRSQVMMLDAARRTGIPKIPAEPVIRHAAAPEAATEAQIRRANS